MNTRELVHLYKGVSWEAEAAPREDRPYRTLSTTLFKLVFTIHARNCPSNVESPVSGKAANVLGLGLG